MLSFPPTVAQRMDEQKLSLKKHEDVSTMCMKEKKLSQTWQQHQLTKNGTADENLFSFLIVDDFFQWFLHF